jgi:hypothetical protein
MPPKNSRFWEVSEENTNKNRVIEKAFFNILI